MRILFIRHGHPDYIKDVLTEKGRREATCLAQTAADLQLGDCYMSPLGRAKETASYSLKATGKTATVLDWLQEFSPTLDINGCDELIHCFPDTLKREDGSYYPRIPWDMMPGYLAAHPEYLDAAGWRDSLIARRSHIVEDYDAVCASLDALLAKYGYIREGNYYHVERENTQTITLFCHLGVTCVMLSHLWNISPFIPWHNLALLTTSVSEVVTEERSQGIASFRALRLGDLSHLYIGREEPSFACRFCETYGDLSQRH